MRASSTVVLALTVAVLGCGDAPGDTDVPGPPLEFVATAYCLEGTTQSGVRARPGIVAADPEVLPVGSVVSLETPEEYAGIYTVLDTGAAIKGERLDVYIQDCGEAREFGRQPVTFHVLRHGWDPQQPPEEDDDPVE